MRITSIVSLGVLASAAIACGPSVNGRPGGDDTGGGPDAGGDPVFPPDDSGNGAGCTKIDVLFVIDNSGSMGQEQTNLIANFPMFITVLDQSGLDYRVA